MEKLEKLPISYIAKIGIGLGCTALLGVVISTTAYMTIRDLSNKGFHNFTFRFKDLTFEASK